MITLFIISFYAISAVGAWRTIHKMYCKGGSLYGHHADLSDLFVTICPGMNTIIAIAGVFGFGRIGGASSLMDRFFRVKE